MRIRAHVGGARNGALGVRGLVAEDRGRLEADVADDREKQSDAQRSGDDGARVDDAVRQSVVPALNDDDQIQDRHDRDLGAQQHRQHAAGQLDVAVAEEGGDRERHRREHPPRQRRAAEQFDDAGAGRTEQAVDARLDRQVADDRDEGDTDTGRKAQRLADIGEERARLLDVRRHRGESHREEQQDHRGDDERRREIRRRCPEAIPSGTTPPITPSGAAAATTMNTMAATPRLPRNWRAGPGGLSLKASGVTVISDTNDHPSINASR